MHLRPFFRNRKISSIGPTDVDAYKAQKAHLSKNTVNHHLTLLISLLRYAKEIKWLVHVPKIKKYKIPQFKSDFKFLQTEEEKTRFLNAAKAEGVHVYSVNMTALYTGMRLGELAGLQWDSIDLKRRLISVTRTNTSDVPKNGEGRHIPILDPLLPILRSLSKLNSTGLLFTNQAGNQYRRDARIFDEVLKRILVRGGFSENYISFHDLRHTFASHWMMGDGNIFKLQRILGHKSLKVTQRYSHLAPNAYVNDFKRLT